MTAALVEVEPQLIENSLMLFTPVIRRMEFSTAFEPEWGFIQGEEDYNRRYGYFPARLAYYLPKPAEVCGDVPSGSPEKQEEDSKPSNETKEIADEADDVVSEVQRPSSALDKEHATQAELLSQGVYGFCAICERATSILPHMIEDHQNGEASLPDPCYEIVDFDGTQVMAPRGTRLDGNSELGRCPECSGVFYKSRLRRHRCGNPDLRFIDEGAGPHFCLMCQLKCEDVHEHKRTVHFDSSIYKIQRVKAWGEYTLTLLPRRTNDAQDLMLSNLCDCRHCLLFTYKDRVKRKCPLEGLLRFHGSAM